MRAFVLVGLALVLGACAGEGPPPPQEMTGAERGQIQAEVLDWADRYLEAATNLDAVGVTLLFDEADAHFFSGARYWSNWQAIRTGLEELYATWEVWDGEWTTRRVDVLSPEAAVLVGEAAGLVRFDDGREFDNVAGLSFVVRKTEEGWKGLFGHVAAARTLRE